MKLYEYTNPTWGMAFKRISSAFHEHSPESIEWVDNIEDSDAQLIHIVGRGEYDLAKSVKNPIIVQHCYYTAEAHALDYPSIWKNALLTTSFHPLDTYTEKKFNFLRIPWGAEPSIFNRNHAWKTRACFVTGHIAETESIDKIMEACHNANYTLFHTGENFKFNSPLYYHLPYLNDSQYSNILRKSKFVFGLRNIEGFEMACVEGLMCGATPVVPKLPTYSFYDGFANFIDMSGNIVEQIENILCNSLEIESDENKVNDVFSWNSICSKLFGEILELWE